MAACVFLTGVRILLPVVGLKNTRRLLGSGNRLRRKTLNLDTKDIVRLLETAARWCPVGSTCLARALTGQFLLRRAGIGSRLCIGVMRDHQSRFQAHAWLEKDMGVILGGSDEEIGHWSPLSEIDERTA
jgi:hypothetical protein